MMPSKKTSGAATIKEANELQRVLIQAAVEQLHRERKEGEVRAATLAAVARIVKDCGVEVDWMVNEQSQLKELVSGLKLDMTAFNRR